MSDCPIQVTVQTEYLANQSEPKRNRYAFAYHITVTNLGDESVQLLSRHWHITDGNNQRQEVQGIGVVGEQPHISPATSYHYTSGVILETPVGTMAGSYQMTTPDGDTFDATIPLFVLAAPGAVH
ncbi:Co2+/Mg2+ efflux protein ApaG [bacterium SCSIO 12696]|nr:Co2+/Mg2+ efflux protein ApaG [bacterium SCSIO 12696]